MLLFLSDNLAHFPYATLEEPLFVAHHIDVTLSVTGTTLLQSFNEVSSLYLLYSYSLNYIHDLIPYNFNVCNFFSYHYLLK